jgi:hypothetical protein
MNVAQAMRQYDYEYYLRLHELFPGDDQIAGKLDTFSINYFNSPLMLDENPVGDVEKARKFVDEMKAEIKSRAESKAGIAFAFNSRLDAAKKLMKDALRNFRLKERIGELEKYYESEETRLTDQLTKPHEGIWAFKKAREIVAKFGLSKIGLGLGGAVTGLAKAFKGIKDFIHDITEHIPVLSGVPPELVGVSLAAGATAIWLVCNGWNKLWLWSAAVDLRTLGRRSVNAQAKLMRKFMKLDEKEHKAFEAKAKRLQEERDARQMRIDEEFIRTFNVLASSYGYQLSPTDYKLELPINAA